MTPIEYLYYKYPMLNKVTIDEVTHLLTGSAVLELMEGYANHVRESTPTPAPSQFLQHPILLHNPYPLWQPEAESFFNPYEPKTPRTIEKAPAENNGESMD